MSLANSKASSAYKETLAATRTIWEDTATGFVEKADTTNFASVTRQLNSTLFLLIRLDTRLEELSERVTQLDTRVRNIEKAKAPAGQNFKTELEEITKQISKISLSEKPKEKGGSLKVIKNPYDILKGLK